jgi:hypothetical protein
MNSGKDYILRCTERPYYLSPPVTEVELSNLLPRSHLLGVKLLEQVCFSVPMFFSIFMLEISSCYLCYRLGLLLHHLSHECPHGVIHVFQPSQRNLSTPMLFLNDLKCMHDST